MAFLVVETEDVDSGSCTVVLALINACNSERIQETSDKSGGGSTFYPLWSKVDMALVQDKEVSGILGRGQGWGGMWHRDGLWTLKERGTVVFTHTIPKASTGKKKNSWHLQGLQMESCGWGMSVWLPG